MKCKVFYGVSLYIEQEINRFLSDKPDINIISATQSSTPTNAGTNLMITIFYKE